MTDSKEWFSVGPVEHPNQERAYEHAEALAADGDRPVEVYRWTRTLVRRYTRQVTVVPEDVTASGA